MADTNNQNQQGEGNAQQNQNQQQNHQAQQNQQGGGQMAQIDYEKLASVIAGKQQVTEDTVLKNYLKQQGLSGDELTQAIATFKEQKAEKEPNVEALQNQVKTAQQAMIRSQIENKALLMHQELEVEIGTISYLMKLVNLEGVVDQSGAINDEKLKEAFEKVLKDVPQLKRSGEQNAQGFRQVGAGQSNNAETHANAQPAVASKRWNRFN